MKQLFSILLISIIFACNSGNKNNKQEQISININTLADALDYDIVKPEKSTVTGSQFFKVSGLKQNLIESENGTILIIPKGAFKNSKGEVVEKDITIELKDENSLDAFIENNLANTDINQLLDSKATLYINATSNGENLSINRKTI